MKTTASLQVPLSDRWNDDFILSIIDFWFMNNCLFYRCEKNTAFKVPQIQWSCSFMIAETVISSTPRWPHPLDPGLCLMAPVSPAASLFSVQTPDFTGRLKHTFLTSHRTQSGSLEDQTISCMKTTTKLTSLAAYLIIFSQIQIITLKQFNFFRSFFT